jgi:cytochrome c oxidase subunit IV
MNQLHSKSIYYRVFSALMVLLVLTVAAAMVPFDRWSLGGLGVLLTFLIAGSKAALVVMYFMHVREASRLTRVFVVAGIAWVVILFTLTLNDYLTRNWLPASRGWLERSAIQTR